ncbi:hypothetical protein Pelo_3508 [Pelomyxa schiedti]|nr:hypothetical protein Pelo_3508 [Pelomyxa schiedti]
MCTAAVVGAAALPTWPGSSPSTFNVRGGGAVSDTSGRLVSSSTANSAPQPTGVSASATITTTAVGGGGGAAIVVPTISAAAQSGLYSGGGGGASVSASASASAIQSQYPVVSNKNLLVIVKCPWARPSESTLGCWTAGKDSLLLQIATRPGCEPVDWNEASRQVGETPAACMMRAKQIFERKLSEILKSMSESNVPNSNSIPRPVPVKFDSGERSELHTSNVLSQDLTRSLLERKSNADAVFEDTFKRCVLTHNFDWRKIAVEMHTDALECRKLYYQMFPLSASHLPVVMNHSTTVSIPSPPTLQSSACGTPPVSQSILSASALGVSGVTKSMLAEAVLSLGNLGATDT